MNLSLKIFITFLAASFALIAWHPDSIAPALIPVTLCASFCFDHWLKAKAKSKDEALELQMKALKERLDMLTIQKGMSR